MSSTVSGSFQDHYIVLGVDPSADAEMIQAAYAKLAQKYHPDNVETGDANRLEIVNQAYEVLSDPVLRASFNQVKGVDHESGNPKFTGAEFFRALELGAVLRSAILCILYDRRRVKSFKPSLSMRQLEGMLHGTAGELNFSLWYLKQRGFVVNDDKSNMQISVEGMDYLEQNRPSAEAVMPFVKAEALATPPQAEKPPVAEAKLEEARLEAPVLGALRRALQRNNPSEEGHPLAPPRSQVRTMTIPANAGPLGTASVGTTSAATASVATAPAGSIDQS